MFKYVMAFHKNIVEMNEKSSFYTVSNGLAMAK